MTILYRWLVIAVLVAAAAAVGWVKGAASVQTQWDAANAQAWATADRVIIKQGEVIERIRVEYVDRVKVVKQAAETRIERVTEYVPTGTCDLPGSFRLYHDAAARGDLPESPATGVDAAPVSAQDLARTINENYTGCLANAELIEALQAYARTVSTPQEF